MITRQIKVRIVQIKVGIVQIKVGIVQIKVRIVQIKVGIVQINIKRTGQMLFNAQHKVLIKWTENDGLLLCPDMTNFCLEKWLTADC